MAYSSFVYGELKSRDFYDQISQYYIHEKIYKTLAYISVACNDVYKTVPMRSAGAIYYFLDRLWVFEGEVDVPEDGCKLYNFYFVGIDDKSRPMVGFTIALDKPIELKRGTYSFRLEYTFTVDDWFASDFMCLDAKNYKYAELLCAI